MKQDLRDTIRAAVESSAIRKPDFIELLSLVDEHYDKMEATISQSLTSTRQSDSPQSIDAIFDSVTIALLAVGADGVIRNCNKASNRCFETEDLVGTSIDAILPGAKGMPVADYLVPYLANLDDTQTDLVAGEVDAVRINSERFVAEINASCIQKDSGHTYVICLRDLTNRRKSQRALRENEERYRALVEYAPEAILVFDVDDNRFTDANDNACILFNLSRARLMTIGPDAITPADQPDGTPSFGVRRGYIDRAFAGEHPRFEWLHQDSDGREIPCEVRFSQLPSDERRLIRVSITNISDRKRSEALSFAQNKVLEMIAASAPHDKTLRGVCRLVERFDAGLTSAVMLLDKSGKTVSVAEAPNLSGEFKLGLKHVAVSADSFTSGRAIATGKDCITENISTDPAWKRAGKATANHDLKAVWSFLMHGEAQQIIGTLDVYCDQARTPTTDEIDQLSAMARLAGIATKRHLDETKLRNSESRYRGLFENVVDGVYIASAEGEIVTANPALVEMLGYDSVEDLKSVGATSELYVNPVDRERVFARLEAEGVVKNFEYRLRRKDGEEIVVLENSRAIRDESGQIVSHEGSLTDISERKRAETRVFEEKERAEVTLQSIGDGVITTDASGVVDYINPVAQDLTGWDMRSACQSPISDIMMIVNKHTRANVENPVIRCLKEGRVMTLADDSVLITRDGDEIPIQDSAAPIRDRIGNIVGSVMIFHDVSKESRLVRQLSYQAAHDTLTGLINRREFENHMVGALERIQSNAEESSALLYIDLDQFKVVNDTFGHTAGDALLRQLSQLIQGKIRSTDVFARLGGDEFGILLERCGEERALDVAENIRCEIEGFRFEWKKSFTTMRCSIGVVMVTPETVDIVDVMSSADVACYSAKDNGRNQIHLYRESDTSLRHEEMKWVSRITNAVDEDRFELFFQPIIGIGKHEGERRGHYELLLRMRDENGELVGPDQFIPAAERYNLMSMLDRWVIKEALTELADRSAGDEARYTLAINLSGNSLSEDRFLDFVTSELVKHSLPNGAICFEITETAAISNLSRVVHFMQALKKLGCKFSLDDFGSGLSSFTYLKNLPVDYLKIDGQFISNVAEDRVDESMVVAISSVGHAMGIETIAERVETRQVLEKLGSLGIEFAQGYYIARPASVQSFKPWDEVSGQLTA